MDKSSGSREKQIVEAVNPHSSVDWAEQLTAFVDGELEVSQGSQIQAHLDTCVPCQAQVKATQALKQQLSQLPPLSVPRSFALTSQQAHRLKSRPLYTAVRVALTVAAALLLFICALDFVGLTNQTTIVTTKVAATGPTSTPDISLPPIGTRPACIASNQQGDVVCSNGPVGNLPATATPTPAPPATVTTTSTPIPVRLAEIGLVALILALAAFALAVRPRAPTKIRF